MRAPATRAVIDLTGTIDRVIAPRIGVEAVRRDSIELSMVLSFLPLPKPTTMSRYVSVIIRDCGQIVACLQQLVSVRDDLPGF